MERVHVMMDKFRKDLDKYEILKKMEKQTKVPKEYLVGGAFALFGMILLFGFGAGLLINILGFAYPAYCSFKVIETQSRADDKQWLTYWVIFSAFSLLETFVDFLLYWIPFYFAFKLGFLAWCMLPSTNGAAFLYDTLFKDLLKASESKVDAAAKKAG